MSKKNRIIILILSTCVASIIFLNYEDKLVMGNEKLTKKEFEKTYKNEKINCLHFIEKKLSAASGGIHTNYVDTKEKINIATFFIQIKNYQDF